MIDAVIDRADAIAIRHARPIGFAGVAWLVLSCAAAAGFVTLPDFVPFGERTMMIAGAAFNIAWWGFLNPRILRRRSDRALVEAGRA